MDTVLGMLSLAELGGVSCCELFFLYRHEVTIKSSSCRLGACFCSKFPITYLPKCVWSAVRTHIQMLS